MIWYLNSKLYLNLSCAKDFGNLNYMVTWCISWRRLLAGSNNFSAQFIKSFPFLKRFVITLIYCKRLHAWWSTQSRLAALLSSLIARLWVGLQTLWRFQLKDLYIDEMVGAWCFGCCQAHWCLPVGFLLLRYSVFLNCWVLIFALSPFYILIYMFLEMMHW